MIRICFKAVPPRVSCIVTLDRYVYILLVFCKEVHLVSFGLHHFPSAGGFRYPWYPLSFLCTGKCTPLYFTHSLARGNSLLRGSCLLSRFWLLPRGKSFPVSPRSWLPPLNTLCPEVQTPSLGYALSLRSWLPPRSMLCPRGPDSLFKVSLPLRSRLPPQRTPLCPRGPDSLSRWIPICVRGPDPLLKKPLSSRSRLSPWSVFSLKVSSSPRFRLPPRDSPIHEVLIPSSSRYLSTTHFLSHCASRR